MLPRLKFPAGEQRIFVDLVFRKSNLNAEDLGEVVGVSARTIRDWRRGKFNITQQAVCVFCSEFGLSQPGKGREFINTWRKARLAACVKGGISHFEKYGALGTPEGRRKGGLASIKVLRERGLFSGPKQFQFPKGRNVDLAEWVGIMLGDGSMTRFGSVHITLNMTKDAEYRAYVEDLGKRLFGEAPRVFFRKSDNATISYYNGVKLVEYLTQLGLKVGNKVKQQVGVPEWIRANSDFSTACLMGLLDTDGCICTHKYKVGGKKYSYKKLVFSNRSIPLIEFVHNHLRKLGFEAKLADRLATKYVWLYNSGQTRRYLEVVGTHNPRILKQGG